MSMDVAEIAGLTPYEQGEASFRRGDAGPPIPKGDATWAERLFNRGWCDARAQASLNQDTDHD